MVDLQSSIEDSFSRPIESYIDETKALGNNVEG